MNLSVVDLIQTVLLSGAATTLATQLLKSAYIPLPANKYPRTTAAVISVIATAIAIHAQGFNLAVGHDFATWATLVVGTLYIAATTYNNVVKKESDYVQAKHLGHDEALV